MYRFTRGDDMTVSLSSNLNKASWTKVMVEIKGTEQSIRMSGFGKSPGQAYDVDFDPDFAAIYTAMGKMLAKAETITPLFPSFSAYIRTSNAANFATNGLPVGGWRPLSPAYGAWKLAHGFPVPMVITGKLLSSLTVGLVDIPRSSTSIVFRGAPVKYAKFHQYGTRHMPARQIVFEPAGFGEFAAGLIGKWIVGFEKDEFGVG